MITELLDRLRSEVARVEAERDAAVLARDALATQLASVRAALSLPAVTAERVEPVPAPALARPHAATESPEGPLWRSCELCQATFPVRSNRQRVCTKCRPDLEGGHTVTIDGLKGDIKKTCTVCATEFAARYANQRVCDGCRHAPRACARCHETFTPPKARGPVPLLCPTCREKRDHRKDASVPPPAPVTAAEPPIRYATCPSCGHGYNPQPGDQVCATCRTRAQERWGAEPADDAPAPGAALPERRCGRCCHKYQPTSPRDFYCQACRAKGAGAPKAAKPAEPELEPNGWHGREPLTPASGFGSTLSPAQIRSAGF